MNIFFSAEHFGSACAIVPLYLEARKRRDVKAHIFLPSGLEELKVLQGVKDSINWFSIAPGDYHVFLETLGLSQYDVLVTGVTGIGGTSLASAVVSHGRSKTIPTIGILDSWINYSERFDDLPKKQKLAYLPDYLAIPDEFAYEDLNGLGFPANRLWITGHPYIEVINNEWTVQKIQENRNRIAEKLSLSGDILVVFVHEAISDIYPGEASYTEYESLGVLIDAVNKLQKRRKQNICMVIQIHPRTSFESEKKLESFMRKKLYGNDFRFSLVRSPEPLVWCMAADLVIGMTSILLTHSVLLGKKVVVLQPGIDHKMDKQIVSRKKIAPLAVNEQQLIEELFRCVDNDNGQNHSGAQWNIKKMNVCSGIIDLMMNKCSGKY